jgi:hypothetical protein
MEQIVGPSWPSMQHMIRLVHHISLQFKFNILLGNVCVIDFLRSLLRALECRKLPTDARNRQYCAVLKLRGL